MAGVSAIFSAVAEVNGMAINAVFGPADLPDYQTYPSHQCPLCGRGQKVDALVNSHGYSKL